MTLSPDLAAFLATILRGGLLSAQALVIGGAVFTLALSAPFAGSMGRPGAFVLDRGLVWLSRSGLLLFAMAALSLGLAVWNMVETLALSPVTALGADFVRWVAASGGAGLVVWAGALSGRRYAWPVVAGVMIAQVASIMSGHAAARVEGREFSMVAVFCHQFGAAIWIGGIPYFLLALSHVRTAEYRHRVGLRFSHIAMVAVGLLVIGAVMLTVGFVGSVRAQIGTAYGAMALTKGGLLAVLLLIGLTNAFIVRRAGRGGGLAGLPRLAEVEIGIGFAILFIAASLASQPPGIDQMLDPAAVPTFSEIADRMAPRLPRLVSPDATLLTAYGAQATAASAVVDREWSEFNHNWAGLFVVTIGLLALLERSGRASWARHWPLALIVLAAWLLVRSDPESWPVGPVGFFEVMQDPEVLQHRLVVLLIVPFGLFEWAVRTHRLSGRRAPFVFPLLCAIGGLLLLAHSHSLNDVKQRTLIELTHLPMGALGLLAGWSRWLELRSGGDRLARIASWIWPLCFLAVGILLMNYRES